MTLNIFNELLELKVIIQMIFGVLIFAIFFSELIANKKFCFYTFISLIINLFLVSIQYLLPSIYQTISQVFIFDIRYIFILIEFILFIWSLYLFKRNSKIYLNKLIHEENIQKDQFIYIDKTSTPKINLGGAKTYFYLNKKSRVKNASLDFYSLFKSFQKKDKKWYETVERCIIDSKEVEPKQLFKLLNVNNEDCSLIIYLINGRKIELLLVKIPVKKNNKIKGYQLVNRKEIISEEIKQDAFNGAKQKLYNYLCMLNTSVAFYDQEKNAYILNKKFMELLNVQNSLITYLDFQSRVCKDDITSFRQKVNNPYISSYNYRVKTVNGYMWVVENTLRINNEDYNLLYIKEEYNDFGFKALPYTSMITEIQKLINSNSLFACLLISFRNVLEINEKNNCDNTQILISKFFENLSSKLKKQSLEAYRFGEIEYGIIFKDYEEYNFMIRSLKNNTSSMLKMEVYLGEKKYTLKNKVGIVESNSLEKSNADDYIKCALNALDVACDKSYENDFCIYYPPKKNKKVYNLIDYGIDTSNDFLNNIDYDENKVTK